jgi:uncharacterized membrane protein YhaH (DUF805 family)
MDFAYLYTSPTGRLNRQPYWIASIILAVVLIVLYFVLSFAIGPRFTKFILMLALLYPAYMLILKRLHDRDRPDYFAYIMLAPTLVNALTDVAGLTGNPLAMNSLDYLLGIVGLGIAIWSFVELGCLRGTVGPNQHGPDPLGTQPA